MKTLRTRPERWPIATLSVLAVTVVVTLLQVPFPAVRLALWRDPHALAAGQVWRLVTPLLVQYDAWWQVVTVFALIAGIGIAAERLFGPGRWLLLYLCGGVVGHAFGFGWQPYDAGASVGAAGLLGFVWFGWGQANAAAGLRLGLAVAGVTAALVAVAGGIQAVRGPAPRGVLHDRQASRRYGIAVGVELALAGAGAAVLAAAGQGDFIPVWVCAVVGVHFLPLAALLQDRLLVPLGVSVATVALVALVASLATGIAPGTVTGVGAGTLLTGFGVAALTGVHAPETPRRVPADRPV
jgi:hypothetical protein